MEAFRKRTWPDGIEGSVLAQKTVIRQIPVHAEHRRATHQAEGRTLVNSIYGDTGCIVVAHWDQQSIKCFDVFAGPGSVNAIAAINKWVARGDEKSRESSAWAKMPAFNQEQWLQEQLERIEDEQTDMYLGPVPEAQNDESMRSTRTVEWPEVLLEDEILPRTVFGNDLQALNDIRKQDRVFITLQPNHAVEILGFEEPNVEAAVVRYKSLLERTRAEQSNTQQATNMILDESEGIDVVLGQAESWWPNHIDMVVPRLLPSVMMQQPGGFRDETLPDPQLGQIRESIKRSLEAVSYRRGYYDFAVRLGCVALDSEKMDQKYVGRKHAKDKFFKSITGAVELKPKKWLLNDMLGTQLYHRIIVADDVFEPIKAAGSWGTLPSNLKDTYPSLRGTWVFRDPSDGPKQHALTLPPNADLGKSHNFIVVQIDWTDDGEGSYDKTETRFYRLDRGSKGPKMNMDINLLELGESRSWSFNLESMTPIPQSTVHPVLTGFAQRTDIKKGYDVASKQSFAQWDSSPSVKALLLHGRLDKIYSFGVRKTYYKIELMAMWYPGRALPCWGLAVRHIEWATRLAELERLQTGQQANWGNDLETFLPNDGCTSFQAAEDFGMGDLKLDGLKVPQASPNEGVRVLMNTLLQLSKIVSSVTQEGGVQI